MLSRLSAIAVLALAALFAVHDAAPTAAATPAGADMPGDTNCDNEVTPADGLELLKGDAGLPADDDCAAANSDLTCDGQATAADVPQILLLFAGMQPEPCTPEEEPPTSLGLIDEAVAAGDLDEDTATLYKLYYLFGDDQLPGEYATDLDPGSNEGEAFLRDLWSRFTSLSPEMQDAAGPYLVQPFYVGSWWDLRNGAAAAVAGSAVTRCTPLVTACAVSDEWTSITTINNKVRIWYPVSMPGGATQAGRAKSDIDTILWPELTAPMGQEPLSDAGFPNNGIDGLIDIMVTDEELRSHVEPFVASGQFPKCESDPGYMVIAPYDRLTLAHEFMHLIEIAFPAKDHTGVCGEWDWIDEGVSNWAVRLIYPESTYGHPSGRRFANQLEFTLDFHDDEREYGTWLFWRYLSKLFGNSTIGDIYEARASEADSIKAIDQAIPGNFAERWKEFALYAWNEDPIKYFQDWDDFTASPEPVAGQYPEINLDGEVDQVIELESLILDPLSARHLHFIVPDDVRSLGFYNGFGYTQELVNTEMGSILSGSSYEEAVGLHIWALLKVNGAWQEPQDWTLYPYRHFCTDAASERVEELVLIYSNSQFEDPTKKLRAQGAPTTLFASNFGCYKWQGDITQTYTDEYGTEVTSVSDMVFERDPAQVSPEIGGGYNVNYVVTSGGIDWDYDWRPGDCAYTGHGDGLTPTPYHVMGTQNFFLSGPYYRAAQGSINAVDLQPVTLTCPGDPPEMSEQYVALGFPGTVDPAHTDDTGAVISGSIRDGPWEYSWHLEAVRE